MLFAGQRYEIVGSNTQKSPMSDPPHPAHSPPYRKGSAEPAICTVRRRIQKKSFSLTEPTASYLAFLRYFYPFLNGFTWQRGHNYYLQHKYRNIMYSLRNMSYPALQWIEITPVVFLVTQKSINRSGKWNKRIRKQQVKLLPPAVKFYPTLIVHFIQSQQYQNAVALPIPDRCPPEPHKRVQLSPVFPGPLPEQAMGI